jgi:hypothetical protein
MAKANTIESKCEFIYVCDNIHLTLQSLFICKDALAI